MVAPELKVPTANRGRGLAAGQKKSISTPTCPQSYFAAIEPVETGKQFLQILREP
jgi:hypothetical protein